MVRFLRRAGVVLVLVAVASTASCGALARMVFEAPVVRFQSIQLQGIDFNGARLRVNLRVVNPNRYALTATGARYELRTNDSILVGSGEAHDVVRIGGHDSATVSLPVAVSWSALGSAGGEVLRSGVASYRVTGDVYVRTLLGTFGVPVQAQGRAGRQADSMPSALRGRAY